ncbi:MAG TPA: DUF1565 domain-containing protein [Oscillatoriaceae cyanobacterium M33_DOE_052]|nr:DUF1565 domain-containing protein [Oscillatoriaceae cyanobacterium M33_DOE_052]
MRSKHIFTSVVRLGLATSALLWIHPIVLAAPAADRSHTTDTNPNTLRAEINQIFVNPNSGNDTAKGTEQAPLKTITRALQVASEGTTIILAPAQYSTATGEVFPLQLKTGVTLKGNPESRGQGILIQGGGAYMSRTAASQNVAIVGANGATLTGVTVTNSNRRGYGLWIESTNTTVTQNTFTGSTHDGISVNGTGTPTIRENTFVQNGANGLSIFGSAKPQVQSNQFERTGFGINIAQEAAPMVVSNRIRYNTDGIVVQGAARPILRQNQIEGNQRSGLVTIANARPDLGNSSEPGGNIFTNNREYDINAEASKEIIAAVGNQLSPTRVAGRIELRGVINASTPNTGTPTPVSTRPPAPSNPRPLLTNRTTRTPENPSPTIPASTSTSIPVPTPSAPINIPVPAPQTPSAPPPQRTAAPPAGSRGDTLPVLLPVPSQMPPVGNTGGNSPVIVSQTPQPPGSPPPPPAGTRQVGRTPQSGRPNEPQLRYRVTVDAPNARIQGRVRDLVPEAFRTILNGQVVMQVGVFTDWDNANQIVQMLSRNGITAELQNLP